jgi:hypothetical protein
LRPSEGWQQRLLQVNNALRNEMGAGSAPSSDAVQNALKEWDALIDLFVVGDAKVRVKVSEALQSDVDLQWNWILTPDLLEFMKTARETQATTEA